MGSTEAPVRAGGAVESNDPGQIPRVLFIMLRPGPEIYGGTRCLLTFLRHQKTIEPRVLVLSDGSDSPAIRELRASGIRWEHVSLRDIAVRQAALLRKIRRVAQYVSSNIRIWRHVRSMKPGIVHVDAEGFFLAGVAGKVAGCRVVQHLRGLQPGGRVRRLRQLALAWADRNVAVSSALREFYVAGSNRVIRARVAGRTATVFDPLLIDDITAFKAEVSGDQARRQLGIPADEVAIGLIGGIFSAKGQREFLEAVAPEVIRQVPVARFYIVGGIKDPVYHEECRRAVREKGLDGRVVFTGYRADIYRWYRALDVVALPSRREGFPGALLEAQAFGVPVVASDIVGTRDAVEHGTGGFRAPSNHEFATALIRLSRDPRLRLSMGESGSRYVQRFHVERVTGDLEALFHATVHVPR